MWTTADEIYALILYVLCVWLIDKAACLTKPASPVRRHRASIVSRWCRVGHVVFNVVHLWVVTLAVIFVRAAVTNSGSVAGEPARHAGHAGHCRAGYCWPRAVVIIVFDLGHRIVHHWAELVGAAIQLGR